MRLAAAQIRPLLAIAGLQRPYALHESRRPSLHTSASRSVQSPRRNFSVQRVAPSVRAVRARTAVRGSSPVTARAATDGSAAAVKKPPSLLRTVASAIASVARLPRGTRASRSSSRAVTVPSVVSARSAESERTRYSTADADQRARTTVA
ncbi:hypothetical protein MBT84_15020 [Streptomyces sp. MBT84]|nr:hypothetical protein [Streptomyces sp. MBT84]